MFYICNLYTQSRDAVQTQLLDLATFFGKAKYCLFSFPSLYLLETASDEPFIPQIIRLLKIATLFKWTIQTFRQCFHTAQYILKPHITEKLDHPQYFCFQILNRWHWMKKQDLQWFSWNVIHENLWAVNLYSALL